MTKEEAYTILNVTAHSGNEEIESSFKKYYTDYQIRLTNAPTPNLKRLYQKNLSDLELAASILKQTPSQKFSDLPSAEPIYNHRMFERDAPVVEKPKAAVPIKPSESKPKEKSRSVFIPYVVAIAGIAIASLMGILYNKQVTLYDNASKELGIANQAVTKSASELNDFRQGKFVVLNGGKTPFKVKDYIIVYRDLDGTIKKYFASPEFTINPNQRKAFQGISGNNVEWDGSVISYSLNITSSKGNGTFSGLWSKDAVDGILRISLDDY